ncbi:MAG: hypothetical protein CMK98_05390 [Pseudomonas sp.]|nr:hypothetical protein [Pseudomonas sp.]|tara:strand:+ start:3887 stop:5200 length:1314 start_codon:yes stop_codon:yes gene_type:complete
MGYKAYPEYSHSDVEWLGKVPADWEVRRLKFSSCLINEKIDAQDSTLEYLGLEHIESWTGKRIADNTSTSEGIASKFSPGDVLFGKLRPYLAKVWQADSHGISTTEVLVIRPDNGVIGSFLKYYMLSRDFIDVVNGSTYGSKMPRANWEFIGNLSLLIPTIEEQRQIAQFIDHKTSQIDRLIKKKQELIEKLQEQIVTATSQAITTGLGKITLKSSPVAWLEQVPEHWTLLPLKFLATIGNGSTPARDNPEYWFEGDIPWLNSSNANKESVISSDQFVTETALRECHLPLIEPPAVLVGITGQGRTRGMATLLRIKATINQHLAYIKTDSAVLNVEFLVHVLTSAYQFLRSESDGGGSTKGAITCEQLANLKIPVPPIAEQKLIADLIASELERSNASIEKAEVTIDCLQEYRAALITAAVTGQIDVRDIRKEQQWR